MSYTAKKRILLVLDLIVAAGVVLAVLLLFSVISKNKQLSETAASLAAQNKALTAESQKHIDCIANLFARYTRDRRPITITDLDTCKSVQSDPTGSTAPNSLPAPDNSNKNGAATQNKDKNPNPTNESDNTNTQERGLLCRVTLNLIGCNQEDLL